MTESWRSLVLSLLDKRTSINSSTGCWEFQGTNGDGYGQLTIDGVFYYTHRLSAIIYLGYTSKSGLDVLHKCNNKCCWNPEHLYLGSNYQNILDKMAAGNATNQNKDKTHCVNGHEFTPYNTYNYIENGKKKRGCKKCRLIRSRESHRRKAKRMRGNEK